MMVGGNEAGSGFLGGVYEQVGGGSQFLEMG